MARASARGTRSQRIAFCTAVGAPAQSVAQAVMRGPSTISAVLSTTRSPSATVYATERGHRFHQARPSSTSYARFSATISVRTPAEAIHSEARTPNESSPPCRRPCTSPITVSTCPCASSGRNSRLCASSHSKRPGASMKLNAAIRTMMKGKSEKNMRKASAAA